jgi:hypothetical protein
MHLRVAVAAVLAATLAHPAAQSAPLPDADRFFAEARKRLASNGLLQSRYMYRERVTEVRANPFGRIGTGPVETFEVYPVQGQELTYRRLVARDGKPLPPDELVAQDRRFLARYNEWRRRLAAEGQNEREARLRKIADERARDQKQAAEVMELFTFALQRREALDGMPAIVVSFRPKPGAQPHTREARVAASFAGHAWVHEHEHEVIRVEADAVTDATIGWGVLHIDARTHRRRLAAARDAVRRHRPRAPVPQSHVQFPARILGLSSVRPGLFDAPARRFLTK